jgi:orotate phosphoribosyltransferase
LIDFRQEFLAFALARDVLRFGEFVTKAGRRTPYFFNAGLFNDGESLERLGRFYAEALLATGLTCDQLFGPAYKGIILAAAAVGLPKHKNWGRFAFLVVAPWGAPPPSATMQPTTSRGTR